MAVTGVQNLNTPNRPKGQSRPPPCISKAGQSPGRNPPQKRKKMKLGINLDDVVEQKAASKGRYNLQITGCKEKESGPHSKRPGSPMLAVSIGFQDEPNVPNITHYISLPETEEDSFKALLLKRFLVLFNIPFGPDLDTEQLAFQMIGATAHAEVGHTSPNESGDVYNTLIVPKLRGEN